MDWGVELTTKGARLFKKLDRPAQLALSQALDALVRELAAGIELPNVVSNVTKMVGIEPPEWRLRAGDYRARFYIEHRSAAGDFSTGNPPEMEGVVVVFKVGHRRDVYRD